MKLRRVIPTAAVLLLLTSICYMLWPHSFAEPHMGRDTITDFQLDTAKNGISFMPQRKTYAQGMGLQPVRSVLQTLAVFGQDAQNAGGK